MTNKEKLDFIDNYNKAIQDLHQHSWIDEEIKKLNERKEKYPPDSYLRGVIDGSIATLESIKEINSKQ